jgi:hypothetical protein
MQMCGGLGLTHMQRLYAFGNVHVILGIMFGLGFLISVLATFSVFTGQFNGFAVLYTIGNIISWASTGFLIGFMAQLKVYF